MGSPGLFGFAAKEIQGYVFRSDKLKDMVGASELVNDLCESFLDECLRTSGAACRVLSRAAGSARVRFDDAADARQFAGVWPLLVDEFAPGLVVVNAVVDVRAGVGGESQALAALDDRLAIERQTPWPALPEIPPIVDRAPRTGGAAVASDGDGELVDRETLRKRSAAAATNNHLVQKLTGADAFRRAEWPLDMDEISGPERDYVCVLHADGNDLGATVRDLKNSAAAAGLDVASVFAAFSEAVEATTRAAAKDAYEAVLATDKAAGRNCYAARAIVLGGDDLTIVLRADLALRFATTYLTAFEAESASRLRAVGAQWNALKVPPRLTASAGLAFVKKSFPFVKAYELAESLCAHAKRALRGRGPNGETPAAIAFHRITASACSDYETILNRELRSKDGVVLSMGAYTVSASVAGVPNLEALTRLASALGRLPHGPVRGLIDRLQTSLVDAKAAHARMLEVVGGELAKDYREALAAAVGGDGELVDKDSRTPLFDGHILRVLGAA